jgi:hypothetical protein
MRSVLERSAITRTGELVGTVNYAAPEQLRGGPVGPAADIYALGAVLYTTLTGRPPFPRETVSATARAHAAEPPPLLERPKQLNPVIARAMAKRPGERFKSAGDLADAARVAVDRPSRFRAARITVAFTAGLVAAAIAVIALSEGGSGGPGPRTGRQRTRSDSRAASPLPLTTRTTPAFTFAYPTGWHVAGAELPMGAFMRTRVVSPDNAEAVIIDRSPRETLGLQPWATGVQNATSETTGYQLISLGPETVGSRPAVVWRFAIASSPYPDRVDIFQQFGAGGYAVLSEGRTFARVGRIAVAVATSLRPR